ncbi:nuclear transport factor 2 family protein [Gordonia sp. PDNC005]|uniref:nuclear transport factor 2 family protein n=1 Tax=unclassified Gordonia (in: high G+C Gram-positive bacteria) TaxID=2657482 RepID=UPI0019661EB5|nr:nuclear transport factor 2 family protein [Gordonia sp. PDNC005]QRY62234.1 nuclear transport factor 2 family protein [Gordonia sp. PDNC005]
MTIEERLDALEDRLRSAEDRLAIMDLVYSYGAAVDTGSAQVTAGMFTPDGVYDVDTGLLAGRQEIAAMVEGEPHQGLIAHGCGHLMTAPQITLDGDRATVRSYSQLIVRRTSSSGFAVARLTANRWELIRVDDGWRVERRVARVVDGSDEPRGLLRPQ